MCLNNLPRVALDGAAASFEIATYCDRESYSTLTARPPSLTNVLYVLSLITGRIMRCFLHTRLVDDVLL